MLCVLHGIINAVSESIPTSPAHVFPRNPNTAYVIPSEVYIRACVHTHRCTGHERKWEQENKNSQITTVMQSSPWYPSMSLWKGPLAR